MNRSKSILCVISLVTLQFQTAQAQSTLTPTRADRGQEKYFFQIPGTDRSEACIIPRFLPGVDYPKKALEKMRELCSYSFYAPLASGQKKAVACQKDNSTNPGLNIYDTTTADAKGVAVTCDKDDALSDQELIDKLGKYKQSTSCSYTPGIMAYYHVSQALGKVVNVPDAVMRTVDIEYHKSVSVPVYQVLKRIADKQPKERTKAENDYFNPRSVIYLTLGSILSQLQNPAASKKQPQLFTDGLKESYGALLRNPNGEEKYDTMFVTPNSAELNASLNAEGKPQQNYARAMAFGNRQADFNRVKNPESLPKIIISKDDESAVYLEPKIENAAKLIAMRDVSDMVVIDSLMSQEDRFGNIHYQPYKALIVSEDGERKLELVKAKDYNQKFKDQMEANGHAILGESDVKQMILKDNDCSVSRENIQTRARLVEKISHIDPKTYKNLLKFQKSLSDAATKAVFTVDFYFTPTDYAKLQKAADYVAGTLQNRCRAGQLHLDLDVEHYLINGSVKAKSSADCELQ